jgi:type II secretory pathway component GspD/PulD (secretin)
MRCLLSVCVMVFLMAGDDPAFAQAGAGANAAAEKSAIPIAQLIDAVAARTSKKFILDSRVQADVRLAGQNASGVTYNDLLLILKTYGFTAVETGGYVWVGPDAGARYMPVPVASGNDKYPDAQYVTKTIAVRSMPAAVLVPLLRPMLPQQGHLAAVTCTNSLIMVDTFDNVRRIESLIRSLDTGEPYKVPRCEAPRPAESRPAAQGSG